MQPYQRAFVDFMLASGVLAFGDFVTKSGRNSPYFINTGLYRSGAQMNQLAGFYADAIERRGTAFDFLFGPAYKGIPLAVAVAMELSRRGRDTRFCFNRKEAKDHGEGGTLVGHLPRAGERVLIIEDVTTAGTSVRETVPLLKNAAAVTLAGLVVGVDRQERGNSEYSALRELRDEFAMDAFAIVTIDEAIEALSSGGSVPLDADALRRFRDYRTRYGGKD